MKSIIDLNLGYNDAINYKKRENKEFFSKIFIKDAQLTKLCSRDVYFLIGDKGTGKTAYATYMENMSPEKIKSKVMMLGETEYQKFISIKNDNLLKLSDYSDVWQTIILLLFSKIVSENIGNSFSVKKQINFYRLQTAIEEYYMNAFNPEILQALKFVEETSITAKILSQHFKAGLSDNSKMSFEESRYSQNLLYITAKFKEALSSVRLDSDFVIFFDGIDIRPQSIDYKDYIECVKGLADAVWKLNMSFFPEIRDSKGRMRCVMLLRPDIFMALELQNQNTKMRDNAVVLDWRTDENNYRQSFIFSVADRILAANQDSHTFDGSCWNHYFPFDARNVYVQNPDGNRTSFLSFLRLSFHRPRDIVTLMRSLQDHYKRARKQDATTFAADDFSEASVRRDYGEYVLNEIRDQMLFYYSQGDFTILRGFFSQLKGKAQFNYEQFCEALASYQNDISKKGIYPPNFLKSPESFIQFLYDMNIVCYYEDADDEKFARWCFREREATDPNPRVMLNTSYRIHEALLKTLNVGKLFREVRQNPSQDVRSLSKKKENSSNINQQKRIDALNGEIMNGRVQSINKNRKFGVVKNYSGDEYTFYPGDCVNFSSMQKGCEVSFTAKVTEGGKKKARKITLDTKKKA